MIISLDDTLWAVHHETACSSSSYHVSDMLIHIRACWSLACLDVIVDLTVTHGTLKRAAHHQVTHTCHRNCCMR